MSNAPSTFRTETAELPTDTPTDIADVTGTAIRSLAAPVRCVGFWAAVSLPAIYLPMLFAGLPGVERSAFFGLLVAHAVALVVGHGHNDA